MKRFRLLSMLLVGLRLTVAEASSYAQGALPAAPTLGAATAVSSSRVLFHGGAIDNGIVARELSDGRLIVLRDDSSAVLFDSTLREVRRIGLAGGAGLFPLVWQGLGDTTFLARSVGGPFTVIDPAGKVVDRNRFLTIPDGVKWFAGESPDERLDSAGRFLMLSELPSGSRDSATLAWVGFNGRYQNVNVTVRSGSRRGAPGAFNAVDVNDAWVGLSDGSVLVMRTGTCRVEVVALGGQPTAQTALPCPRKLLTRDEVISRLSGASETSTLAPQWFGFEPAYMPLSMEVAPDGRVWIARNPFLQKDPYGDQVYDILDRSGHVVDSVTIPAGRRLIGLGRGVVYLLRVEDGRVERVRTP